MRPSPLHNYSASSKLLRLINSYGRLHREEVQRAWLWPQLRVLSLTPVTALLCLLCLCCLFQRSSWTLWEMKICACSTTASDACMTGGWPRSTAPSQGALSVAIQATSSLTTPSGTPTTRRATAAARMTPVVLTSRMTTGTVQGRAPGSRTSRSSPRASTRRPSTGSGPSWQRSRNTFWRMTHLLPPLPRAQATMRSSSRKEVRRVLEDPPDSAHGYEP